MSDNLIPLHPQNKEKITPEQIIFALSSALKYFGLHKINERIIDKGFETYFNLLRTELQTYFKIDFKNSNEREEMCKHISFISFGNFKCVQFVETDLGCAVNNNIKKKNKKTKKKQKQKKK